MQGTSAVGSRSSLSGRGRCGPARAARALLWILLLGASGAALACGLHRGGSPAANRDLHGPPDVAHYIARLESAERLEELDPEGVVQSLQLPPDAVVADIGSGPGVLSLPLARHLSRGLVYAVDVEPRQLDALRARATAAGIHNIVPVLASYSDPFLPPHGVDLILIADTYHHLDQRVAYLRGLLDDLAAGGRLAILEYKPGDLPMGPPASHKLSHEVRYAELRAAGFERVQRIGTHRYHDFEIWRPGGTAARH